MDLFFTERYDLTTTHTLIVEAADVDRTVIVEEGSGQTGIKFNQNGNFFTIDADVEQQPREFQFILPAGVELWAKASLDSQTSKIGIMVTSVGR